MIGSLGAPMHDRISGRRQHRSAPKCERQENFTNCVAVTSASGRAAPAALSLAGPPGQTFDFDFAHPHPMNTPFDETRPQPSRWDQEGCEYACSNIDWVARCSKRLVGLNPGLRSAEHTSE